jgi:peptide-methionine (R)-S-oxide reductase
VATSKRRREAAACLSPLQTSAALRGGAGRFRIAAVWGPEGRNVRPGRRDCSASPETKEREIKNDTGQKIRKTEQQWRAELTPEQFDVLRQKGTEHPFSGEYDHTFEPGTYRCAGCGAELFTSDAKYDSGCGWPAFSSPAGEEAVEEETDTTYGMVRTEVMCAACGGHLGHVFPDGPHPTGLRYCINSTALNLEEE